MIIICQDNQHVFKDWKWCGFSRKNDDGTEYKVPIEYHRCSKCEHTEYRLMNNEG